MNNRCGDFRNTFVTRSDGNRVPYIAHPSNDDHNTTTNEHEHQRHCCYNNTTSKSKSNNRCAYKEASATTQQDQRQLHHDHDSGNKSKSTTIETIVLEWPRLCIRARTEAKQRKQHHHQK